MADNTTLNPGTGGDTIRAEEKGGAKTQVMLLDIGGTGAESLVTDANPLPVAASALPLPTGAATASAQATGNTTLASILTALGQTLAVGGAVTVSNLPATQPVSGTVGISGTVPVSGPLTDAQLRATAVPVSGTFWQATQPVSAASLPLPTGAATQTTLASIDTDIGALSDAAYAGSGNATVIAALKGVYGLLAAPLPAGSNTIGTVDLGTIGGAATETTLAALNTKTPTLGQTTMAGSSPVVIASNQSALNVSTDNVVDGLVTTGSVTSATTVVTLNMAGYQGGSFHVTNAGTTCTITYEESNDGTNWTLLYTYNRGAVNLAPQVTSTTAGVYGFQSVAAFVRARVSTYTSGTVAITAVRKRQSPANLGVALAGGSAIIGTVALSGTAQLAAGTNLAADVGTQYRANATGAASIFSLLSPATPAATSVKASAGRLLGMSLVNTAAALRSVKFWNTAAASVTLGTTAAIFEVDLAAGQRVDFNLPGGIGFATAITVAVTGAKGLTDNTGSLSASDVSGVLFFA